MSLKLLKKQAESALRSLEIGREYPSNYVLSRFDTAWENNQKDQVIGNMRSVIKKVASRQQYITQNEITSLYDRFSNISGGATAFRDELGDLLRDGYGKLPEPKKTEISKTAADMQKAVSLTGTTPLSDAFSVLFSFGSNDDSGTYNKNLVKKAERLVTLELNSMGIKPDMVKTVTGNDHYILCNAYYKNPDFTTSYVSIPVQVSNGAVGIPSEVVSEGNLVKLNKENVLVTLKTAQKKQKDTNLSKYADLRQTESVSIPSVAAPTGLKEKFEMSEEVLLASSKYSPAQIKLAHSVVSTEVSSWGARAQVKFSGTSKKGMSFMVKTATSAGERSFVVPVEMVGEKVLMPSEFASGNSKYDFSTSGYSEFLAGARQVNNAAFSRESDELGKLSYAQLMDVVIDGVAKKDYKASEDALSTIGTKFGPERFKMALEDFQKMIKTASQSFNQDLIKEAVKRGDLIRTRNSVEWFCPKLGLPLSKIAFDERGRPVPKFRNEKRGLDSIEGTVISTSKIVMS
jgi:hypothetical protein